MIGHFFKLVWNRRRTNALILTELLVSLIGLCFVLTLGCHALYLWRQPLGFDYKNIWQLDVTTTQFHNFDEAQRAEIWNDLRQLNLLLGDMEEITSFTPLTFNVPYSSASMAYRHYIDGKAHSIHDLTVTPAAREVFDLNLIAGRWLEAGDENLDWKPVVATRKCIRTLFGNADPIGKTIVITGEDGERDVADDFRVVGVVDAWRQYGEFAPDTMAIFTPSSWSDADWPPQHFMLKILPGIPAAFEEELVRAVDQISSDWTVTVTYLAESRAQDLREAFLPMLLVGLVAVFMIIMVGLGLVGVLWQSVTRRTEEIGLRRALGATTREIRWQVLGELLALVTVAAGICLLLYLQVPLLPLGLELPPLVYLSAFTLTLIVIYSFVILCGLYPSRLATRVQPAEALQYE